MFTFEKDTDNEKLYIYYLIVYLLSLFNGVQSKLEHITRLKVSPLFAFTLIKKKTANF